MCGYALELGWKEVEGKWMELDGVGDKWKKGRGGGKRRGHTMTLTNCGDLVWVIVGLRHPQGPENIGKCP